MLKHINEHVL
jgi:hypothetical protein